MNQYTPEEEEQGKLARKILMEKGKLSFDKAKMKLPDDKETLSLQSLQLRTFLQENLRLRESNEELAAACERRENECNQLLANNQALLSALCDLLDGEGDMTADRIAKARKAIAQAEGNHEEI